MRLRLLPLLMTALTSPTVAADMIYEEPVPAPSVGSPAMEPVPTYDWGGFHFGIDGGYGWGKFDENEDAEDATAKGGFGGVFLGYDYQFDDWLLGVEGDIQYSKVEWEKTYYEVEDHVSASQMLGFDTKWFGSVRLRAGVPAGRFLPYATGGVAFGRANKIDNITLITPIGVISAADDLRDTAIGYTIGAGVDYALRKRLIGRIEYQYLDLGEFKYPSVSGPPAKLPFKMHTVRVGVGLKF